MNKQEVIQTVKSLKLPADKYVVFSGSSLAAHDIRETQDIDIAVTADLFQKLKEQGRWQPTDKGMRNASFLEGDNIEIASKLEWEAYETTVEQARARATVIDGVPFMSLQDVIEFKQALGRPKDEKDIKLIEEYLR